MKLLIPFYLFLLLFTSACEHQSNRTSDLPPNVEEELLSDSLLQISLEKIKAQDQTLRLLLPDLNKKFEPNSLERKFFRELIQEQDSICIAAITDILDKYGWVSEERVGYEANQTLWLVIQHANLETQEKYLPLLQESVKNKESQGWYLAFLQDRILMYKGEKQIYGSQAKPNAETGKTHIYPIENVATVNERRANLDLESIEEYAESNGYVFDPAEHEN